MILLSREECVAVSNEEIALCLTELVSRRQDLAFQMNPEKPLDLRKVQDEIWDTYQLYLTNIEDKK
jgi:hypothetical protein